MTESTIESSLPNDYKKNNTSMIMSSGVTIDQVYQEIKKIREDMVRKEDLEALVDTVEILSSQATMHAIKKSDRDIQQGRVKTISSIEDLLNESV
jgi:antitoxin YefM